MPGAAIPGVLAPTIFFVGLTSVFGNLTELRGFDTDSYQSFLIPVSMLQGAGFTGAATGVNLARDIEQGWFDRLLASPAPARRSSAGWSPRPRSGRWCRPPCSWPWRSRPVPTGPASPVCIVALAGVMAMGTVAALWGCSLALQFRTQSAAPLMQAGMFILVLFTPSYAPEALLQPWMQTVAEINPVTQVLEMVRQGFVTGGVTWAETWPGIVALAGLMALFAAMALHRMRRMSD